MLTGPKLRRPLFLVFFAAYALYLAYLPLQERFHSREPAPPPAGFWRAASADDLLNKLARYGLADPRPERPLPQRLLHSIAFDFRDIEPIDVRKRAFCDMLAPQVLLLNRRVQHQRASYLALCEKLPAGSTDDSAAVATRLTRSELYLLERLRKRYRTQRHDWLLDRMQPIPPSLVLAQAALESAWGSSRFAREGNNLFGIWTWGKGGMLPQARQPGKGHRVASFYTILAGIERYFELLNTFPSYAEFRRQRKQQADPLQLANCLGNYSARGDEYGRTLRGIIRYNRLTRYDSLQLVLN